MFSKKDFFLKKKILFQITIFFQPKNLLNVFFKHGTNFFLYERFFPPPKKSFSKLFSTTCLAKFSFLSSNVCNLHPAVSNSEARNHKLLVQMRSHGTRSNLRDVSWLFLAYLWQTISYKVFRS